MGSEEDRRRSRDAGQRAARIAHDELEVFGRQIVREGERLFQGPGEERGAASGERLGRDRIGPLAELRFQCLADAQREGFFGSDEHGQRKRIVLRLRDQIGSEVRGARARIGDDDHLGRSGQRVDADFAGELPLRLRHVGVPRTHHGVAARDALGANGQRGDCLRSARPEDARRPGDPRRSRHFHRNRPVPLRRRGDDHLGHSGKPRHRGGHDHRRRIRRASARHVAGGALQGDRQRAQHCAGRQRLLVARRRFRCVECPDSLRRPNEGFADFRRAARGEGVPLGVGKEWIGKVRAVETRRQLAHRCVAPRPHVGDDASYRLGDRGSDRRRRAQAEGRGSLRGVR